MIFMCWMRNFNETSTKRKKLTYKATHSGNNKQGKGINEGVHWVRLHRPHKKTLPF